MCVKGVIQGVCIGVCRRMHPMQGQREPNPSGAPVEKHMAKQRLPDTLQKCSEPDASCVHMPQQHRVMGDGRKWTLVPDGG